MGMKVRMTSDFTSMQSIRVVQKYLKCWKKENKNPSESELHILKNYNAKVKENLKLFQTYKNWRNVPYRDFSARNFFKFSRDKKYYIGDIHKEMKSIRERINEGKIKLFSSFS